MLNLPMGLYGTQIQVRISLGSVDPLEESLTVCYTLTHNTYSIGLFGVTPYHSTGLVLHTHRLACAGV